MNLQREAVLFFELINRKVFRGSLPKITIVWSSRLTSSAGVFQVKDYAEIRMSSNLITSLERLRDTLAHEICHYVQYLNGENGGHGKGFLKYAEKIKKVFPNIDISTKHSYEIQYKYSWECKQCKYIIKRVRNTIKLNKHRCPECRGRLRRL